MSLLSQAVTTDAHLSRFLFSLSVCPRNLHTHTQAQNPILFFLVVLPMVIVIKQAC